MIMVRIGVYRGREKDGGSGLSLLKFDVLNELEETTHQLKEFKLVNRFNDEWTEPLKMGVIYFVNIIPEELGKPINKFEILDKCKFIINDGKQFLITYRKYSGKNLINFYEDGVDAIEKHNASIKSKKAIPLHYTNESFNILQDYINFCASKSENSKLFFNTFTRYILNQIFETYGYSNVVPYKNDDEYRDWGQWVTRKVKNFTKNLDVKFSDWSKLEEQKLLENSDKHEDELVKMFNRTKAAIASKKWKLKQNNKPKIHVMKNKSEIITKKMKDYRRKNKITQNEFADEVGASISVVSQLESGRYNTEGSIVTQILDYIESKEEVVVDDFEDNTNEDTNPPLPEFEWGGAKTQEEPTDNSNNESDINKDIALNDILTEMKFISGQLVSLQNKLLSLSGDVNRKNDTGKIKKSGIMVRKHKAV